MIIPRALDVEIFPNLFSLTFIDVKDYLDKFKDCVDTRGKPKALTECLTVEEIKRRLDTVKCDLFYISDTNDSQLLDIVEYINSMQATFIPTGEIQQAIRYDMYGYNIAGYDNLMVQAFMMRFNHFATTKELIRYLYDFNKLLQSYNDDKDAFYKDRNIQFVRGFKLPWATVDVFKVFHLNSAGVRVDKDSGERVKFGKGLKNVSINLKWHEILDFELPEMDEEEYNAYWRKKDDKVNPKGLEHYRTIIKQDFDRYVLPKYVDHMMTYNKNDTFLVCEIARQKPDEIRLRYSIANAFKIDCLSSARSNISDKLLNKFYSEYSGLHKDAFYKLRTERTALSFNKIIFPHIKFKTKQLQELLEDMKKMIIYRTNKDSFCREIEFYGTTYTLATGGIHSQDRPKVFVSDDKYIYRHHD